VSSNLLHIFDMMDKNPPKFESILPNFINQIINIDFGYVLLIKGSAGTGKTTLALEICSKTRDKARAIYLSTRSNLWELKNQYREHMDEFGDEVLADLESIKISEEALDMITINEQNFLTVFGEFQKLVNNYETGNDTDPVRKVIVIIDSIEKIIEIIQKRNPTMSETSIYEIFIGMARQQGIKLIMISESTEPGKKDYLVDGIVTLSQDTNAIPDHLLRILEINKLRNISIDQYAMPFSLYKGRFYALPGQKPTITLLPIDRTVRAFFKMFKAATQTQAFFVNLLEAKKLYLNLDWESTDLLLGIHAIFIICCLLNDISVFYLYPPDVNIVKVMKAYRDECGDEFLQDHFRAGFCARGKPGNIPPEYVFLSMSKSIFEELRCIKDSLDILRSHSSTHGIMIVLPIDVIISRYDQDRLLSLYQFLYEDGIVKDEDTLFVTNVSYQGMDPVHQRLGESFMSRILFTMKAIKVEKSQIFYWVKLPRPPYAMYPILEPASRRAIESINLLPIV